MTLAPTIDIDLADFTNDPYPALAQMRQAGPIVYVPQLDALLIPRRDDIHREEKRIEVLSSHQPDGLMSQLMGENMMRKDGAAHLLERKALFPALSPRTVAAHWRPMFEAHTRRVLDILKHKGSADLVTDFAMPVSAEALKAITGLTQMSGFEMDEVSQAMIDGCANYSGDPKVTARCNAATRLIDTHIDTMLETPPPQSALDVIVCAGLPMASIRANIKLVISGGQNEPRDAIAGTAAALLAHPKAMDRLQNGQCDWSQAFGEYARWMAPIGMSPRRVARQDQICGIPVEPETRVFLMFGSAGRDEAHFSAPTAYDITRDTQAAITFGAGPHFCAGAAASRCLIAQVALPLLFEALPTMRLSEDVEFTGWAFRGPRHVHVTWDVP